jgi:hypothetical protein
VQSGSNADERAMPVDRDVGKSSAASSLGRNAAA